MASQWLNIRGKKYFIETSLLVSVILAFSHKKDSIIQILKIYCIYVVFYINLKIECKIIAM